MIENEVLASVFDLAIHHTKEGRRCVDYISKAPGHCGTPAINAVPAAVSMVLLCVHRFGTDLAGCTLVGAGQCHA